jgi:hypothetical protein
VGGGFLRSLNSTGRTFSFPNQLIQTTLSELTTPSDAAHLHLLVALFIEEHFVSTLRSFYPT